MPPLIRVWAMIAFSDIFGIRLRQLRDIGKWIAIIIPMAIVVGVLRLLSLGTRDRDSGPLRSSLAALRPARRRLSHGLGLPGFGKSAEGGNSLIVDQIHEPGAGVPCAWPRSSGLNHRHPSLRRFRRREEHGGAARQQRRQRRGEALPPLSPADVEFSSWAGSRPGSARCSARRSPAPYSRSKC